jgi:TolA-binding protein
MTRFILTALLVASADIGLAETGQPESDRELIRQEESDRMDRDKRELRERADDLQRQLETSRELLEGQEKLIERLRRELERLQQQEGQAQ